MSLESADCIPCREFFFLVGDYSENIGKKGDLWRDVGKKLDQGADYVNRRTSRFGVRSEETESREALLGDNFSIIIDTWFPYSNLCKQWHTFCGNK